MRTQLRPQPELENDRIALTNRPPGRGVMYQTWSDLLFLHWAVPPEKIAPLLPPGLDLDTYQGRAYIGLIPFTMTGIRPIWAPAVPGLSNFHETNLRTYVHRQGRNPGVWFFSLDAANSLAVRIARAWFKLPYHYSTMSLLHEMDSRIGEAVSCVSHRLRPEPTPAVCRVRYSPEGEVYHAAPGTLEHFLVERYLLYARNGMQFYSGQVHHSPYPLQSAKLHVLEETLFAAAGVMRPDVEPLVHYARGVSVTVFPPRKLDPDPI